MQKFSANHPVVNPLLEMQLHLILPRSVGKVRARTPPVDAPQAEEIAFSGLLEAVARPFRHEAEARGLAFDVQIDPNLGRTLTVDSKRLQQVLKNLLSNAFKFTEQGGIWLKVQPVSKGWSKPTRI